VSYLHNKRPYITISEIQMAVPSSLSFWEASSEQAWSALHPWSDNVPPTKPFRSAMSMILDPNRTGSSNDVSDDETKQIMVLTLMRFFWSLKAIQGFPMIDVVQYKVPFVEGQAKLLELLDTFIRSPASATTTHTKDALAGMARISQIVHMGHLYAAGDLIDWLHALLHEGPGQERSRARMKEWAAESKKRVREVIYHCAQLLAIVRKYPFNSPLEPFNVFHAGVVLYCAGKMLPQASATRLEHRDTPRRSIRVDQLSTDGTTITPRISKWINDGGPEEVTLFGVPVLACAQGRLQVLKQTAELLYSMRVWGIAQNLHSVIVRLIWLEETD
jgi:hypothetical protein